MKVNAVVEKIAFPKNRSQLGFADDLIGEDRTANLYIDEWLLAVLVGVEISAQCRDNILGGEIREVVSKNQHVMGFGQQVSRDRVGGRVIQQNAFVRFVDHVLSLSRARNSAMADYLVNVMVADKDAVEALEFFRVDFTVLARHVLSAGNEVVEQQDLALAVAGFSPELIDKCGNLGRYALPRDSTHSDRSKVDFSTPQDVGKTKVFKNSKFASFASASVFMIARNGYQRNLSPF